MYIDIHKYIYVYIHKCHLDYTKYIRKLKRKPFWESKMVPQQCCYMTLGNPSYTDRKSASWSPMTHLDMAKYRNKIHTKNRQSGVPVDYPGQYQYQPPRNNNPNSPPSHLLKFQARSFPGFSTVRWAMPVLMEDIQS